MKNTTKAKSRQSSDWIVPHVIKRGAMTLIQSNHHSEIAARLVKHVAMGEPLEPWGGPVSRDWALLSTTGSVFVTQMDKVKQLAVSDTITENEKEWLRDRLSKHEPALLVADGWVRHEHELVWLEWIARRFNCAVVVTDHPGEVDADEYFDHILRARTSGHQCGEDYILQFKFEKYPPPCELGDWEMKGEQ